MHRITIDLIMTSERFSSGLIFNLDLPFLDFVLLLLNSFWSNPEFLYTTQNGCNWVRVRRSVICACAPHRTSLSGLRAQVLKLAHDNPRRTSWRIIDHQSSQRSASEELMPASDDTADGAWVLLSQGHEWDEIWIHLNITHAPICSYWKCIATHEIEGTKGNVWSYGL